ncbi:Intradiol ring-cleavage dioxygenase [Xylariaceae sp. FL0255]|nr:Intradiol ring-cleavage dioxygenase [Xylariaceae sp. FL0255]
MVAISTLALGAASLLISHTVAHAGETHSDAYIKRELLARDNAASIGARLLSTCSNSVAAQALKTRSIKRRAHQVKTLRQKRGITSQPKKGKRTLADLEAYEAINHNMTGLLAYTPFTSLDEIFTANTSCILAPYVTDGPYYVVGEKMRSNVVEEDSSDGVSLFLEIQYIDINTCEAIPSMAIDIWNANATGVYSGIADGEGGLNSTFLRGIQLTDYEGVASFETIFPGHYEGRAPHTYLLAHTNASVESNGTISVWGSAVAHIGQLFWPEDLREEVEANEPYASNTQELTTNNEDMWSVLQADANFDPFPQYIYLGDSIEDGLFAWIQIGINGSADYSTDSYYGVAAYWDADGGHATSSGGIPSGNGTAPSGNSTAAPTSTLA